MFCTWHNLWSLNNYLARRKASDKFLRDKALVNANNPKYYGYQRPVA